MKTQKKLGTPSAKTKLVKDYAKLGDKMTGGLLKKGLNARKPLKSGGAGW